MSAAEHESLGVSFDSGPTRVARLLEAVEVLDQLLRGKRVSLRGEHCWGFSYFTVFNDALDAAAPVVARLSGT
jgi:hypothetical protein